MKRINVVGTSAVGKTTFSRKLADKLDLKYIELDDLFWLNDWQESSDEDFFQKLQQKIENASNGYVIDGNYTRTTHIKWKEIDTVIWLDLPFSMNLFQSIKRAFKRSFYKENLWKNSNNKESFSQLLSRDSIIWWMIKTHAKNRKKYMEMMGDPRYAHIQFIRLRSHAEMAYFLNRF
ncbi:AAA family ATPase [Acinetobacter gerneri]|uniref:Adenylate kinase n=1 Tax=Acinetobacter gerneri DSM 14967 = CIP 107464 = MTCC 9824 TaxID=1120926 RepID=N8Y5Q6_9GAMM|nr:AAA family ATPase [Acinetobacter gerneri]ENV32052.1 hypothetical protein F960_03437 [Acinetobacter gerneri DSM 14967 = CIP 107464 = MTCC 9824]EPR83647.1 putative kinase [Acinetobacter gerneri DSM 14967 = CIP 107464 = MTCC 9824]